MWIKNQRGKAGGMVIVNLIFSDNFFEIRESNFQIHPLIKDSWVHCPKNCPLGLAESQPMVGGLIWGPSKNLVESGHSSHCLML